MKRTKESNASKTGRSSHQTDDDLSTASSLSSFDLKPMASQDSHLSIDDASHEFLKDHKHKTQRRILQALSLTIFLITWVANGEMLQIISTGRDIFHSHTTGEKFPAYDKPFFITWVSYNYMLLGFCSVILHVGCTKKASILYYIKHQWPGRLGLTRSMAICALLAFVLEILNVLFVVGLGCVSVSLSNAIFQLQTVFTVGLSVGCLKDKFVAAEAVGILLSIVGVACIVLPPLLLSDDDDENDNNGDNEGTTTINCSRNGVLWGVLATLISAAIGGAYLVAWRILDEFRYGTANASPHATGLDGLVDTQMTLAMIGFYNLTLGWIMLPLAHMAGLETMEAPPSWWMMHWNGVLEFAFDASTAVAIYMTSPVVVAIVSPLTIPLASITDRYILPTNDDASPIATTSPLSCSIGAVIILAGIVLMELKPDLAHWWWQWQHQHQLHHHPSNSSAIMDNFDKSNGNKDTVVVVDDEKTGLLEIPAAMSYDAEKQV